MTVEDPFPRSRAAWVALALAAVTIVVYLQVGGFEFLNYDDPEYVTKNPVVQAGLTRPGLRWAFTSFHAANWHPLTWLAHMLDVQVFGLDAGAHHWVNLGLHALNAGLLLLALQALTGRFWPSAVVAALFALHPLRVESVAWISERKDLLASTFFFLLLGAHARYARTRSAVSYALVLASLTLGCLAKPMLVTAPFVLLLLDRWPLARSGRGRLVLEKLPLVAIAAASCVVTLIAQRAGGAVGSFQALALGERLLDAGAAYLAYLRATVWPAGLAVFYPHPSLVSGRVLLPGLLGGGLVVALSLLALLRARRWPWFFTGWFWFAGQLVPVIGLVQVGDQAWADRYAYLPLIGLYLALVFGLSELARARPRLAPLGIAVPPVLVALAIVTTRQVGFWKDSRTLFEHALAVTDRNWVAHNNLGLVYLERRELARASQHFQEAAAIAPWFVQARFNLGQAQLAAGEIEEAVRSYQQALVIRPGHPESLLALANLARASGEAAQALALFEQAVEKNPRDPLPLVAFARVLLEEGETDRATNCATSALQLDERLAEAHQILGEIALARAQLDEAGRRLQRALELAPASAMTRALLGRWRQQKQDPSGARAELEAALALDPNLARARYDLGLLHLQQGEREAARGQFQAVLDIVPGDPQATTALAAMLIEEGQVTEAIPLLLSALQRQPDLQSALFNLATAYDRTAEWKLAIEHYEKALGSAPPDPDAALALAWILATAPDPSVHDGEKAVQLATYAVQRRGARALEVLAAALARAGEWEEAVRRQQEAIARARAEQKKELEERLRLYESHRAFTRSP